MRQTSHFAIDGSEEDVKIKHSHRAHFIFAFKYESNWKLQLNFSFFSGVGEYSKNQWNFFERLCSFCIKWLIFPHGYGIHGLNDYRNARDIPVGSVLSIHTTNSLPCYIVSVGLRVINPFSALKQSTYLLSGALKLHGHTSTNDKMNCRLCRSLCRMKYGSDWFLVRTMFQIDYQLFI